MHTQYDCCYEDLFAATGEIRKRYRVIDDCGADFICTMHCVPVEAPRPIEVPVSVIGAAGGTMDVLLNAEICRKLFFLFYILLRKFQSSKLFFSESFACESKRNTKHHTAAVPSTRPKRGMQAAI